MNWNEIEAWFDRAGNFRTRARAIGDAQHLILDSQVKWELLIPGYDVLQAEYRRLADNADECSFIAKELMGE